MLADLSTLGTKTMIWRKLIQSWGNFPRPPVSPGLLISMATRKFSDGYQTFLWIP